MAEAKGKTDKKDLTPTEQNNLHSDLRRFGYLLPTDDEEVEEFEKIYGKTQVIFPEHLKKPKFLREENKLKVEPAVEAKQPSKGSSTVQKIAKPKGKNDYFKKLVLAAHVARELYAEPTFGHVKFVKVYLLCDKVCHMNLSSSYGRYAAGPLDPKQMYSIDAEFKKRKWFRVTKTTHGTRYSPDENVKDHEVWYERYFRGQLDQIARVIELFRKESSDFCEIVATIFYVWMDFISQHKLVNNNSLIDGFYNWGEGKKRFKREELENAIQWMNESGITPLN